ncbi:hypothetical protein G9A89_015367 [Geosiphon pyriformis]|nr:hypothetical protein G9A89_015367 [Geosiphon pyriformis]
METEEGKGKRKQKLRTTSNTLKTTAKHLQTPKQETSFKLPLLITPFPVLLVQLQIPSLPLIWFSRIEDLQSPKSPIQQQKPILTSTNLIDYLAENRSEETESEQETEDSENENKITAYITKIPEFNGENIETSPQEWLDQVIKAGDANGWNAARMLRTIPYFLKGTAGKWFENLTTLFDDWTDKLIKKVCPYVPEDLNSAIQHAKRYKMAIKEANRTKLQLKKKSTNLQRKSKTILPTNNNSNPKDISHSNNEIKTTLHYSLITSLKIAITVEFLATGKETAESYNETNKIGQFYYQPPPPAYYLPRAQYQTIPTTTHPTLLSTCLKNDSAKSIHTTKPIPSKQQQNQFEQLIEQNFHHTALSEGRVAAQQQNPSQNHTTIPPARIAKNANLSDIFPFKFKANESPFLLSNAAANEQKTITVMYTEAEIMDLLEVLLLTIIVTANGMKKTPVGEIDNFLFTLDGITIPVKVFVMNAPHYNSPIKNNMPEYPLLVKAPVLEFEEEKKMPLTETYMALGSISNWAEETEQEIFEELREWKKVRYFTSEPQKQSLYILLKCRDYNKKLSSMGVCISPKEKYKNHTYMLPEECNWIDVAMRGGVCNQTCQYALSILEKVKRETPFDAAYNSALNKLYHYPHDAEMIFDLAMALINGVTKENVCQMKEAKYIEYTMKLAGFDYKDKVEVYHQIASHTYPTQEA